MLQPDGDAVSLRLILLPRQKRLAEVVVYGTLTGGRLLKGSRVGTEIEPERGEVAFDVRLWVGSV